MSGDPVKTYRPAFAPGSHAVILWTAAAVIVRVLEYVRAGDGPRVRPGWTCANFERHYHVQAFPGSQVLCVKTTDLRPYVPPIRISENRFRMPRKEPA